MTVEYTASNTDDSTILYNGLYSWSCACHASNQTNVPETDKYDVKGNDEKDRREIYRQKK